MGWTRFFRRRRWDSERGREIQSYIEIEQDENIARGMPAEEARAAAVRKLGNPRQVREAIYEANSIRRVEAVARDLRLAGRSIWRRKRWAAVVVASLALGIGANTVVFSVVESVLLRPFPYADPERIVLMWGGRDIDGGSRLSELDIADYRDLSSTLQTLAPYSRSELQSVEDQAPIRVGYAGSEVFDTLGVSPLIGPGFPPSNEVDPMADEDKLVMLGYGYWQSRYGGDPDVVGQTLNLNSRPHRIVGVLPRGFFFPEHDIQLWEPISLDTFLTDRDFGLFWGVGRLEPGVSVEAAQEEMDAISRILDEAYPRSSGTPRNVGLFPIHEVAVGHYTVVLWLLLGAVAMVLLIACANVANLFLAQSLSRSKELAIRATLGGGWLALIRQILTESLLLAFIAGAVAVALAFAGIRLINGLGLVEVPRIESIEINLAVLLFAAAASILTGLLAGIVPAWKASGAGLTDALKQGAPASSRSGDRRLGDALVVAEVSLALILLVGAGLLVRSSVALSQVDWGFDPENASVVAVRATPEFDQDSLAERVRFADTILQRLRAIPNVLAAGAGVNAPLLPVGAELGIRVVRDGRPVTAAVTAARAIVTPGYLGALGIEVRGREFGQPDAGSMPPTTILSARLAQQLFGDEEPIGQVIHFATLKASEEDVTVGGRLDVLRDGGSAAINDFEVTGITGHTVIGVADDVKVTADLGGTPTGPVVYVDYRRFEDPWTEWSRGALSGIGFATGVNPAYVGAFVIRTEGDPQPVIDVAKAAILEDHPEVSFLEATPMSTLVSRALGGAGQTKLMLALSSVFGALSLALATAGIYGVISHRVGQRTYEIGVRMAMGAEPRVVLGMVLGQGLRLTLIGLTLGLAGAWTASRLLESMLFGVSTTDPVTFVAVTVFLLGVALAASFVPARRASRIDPLVATRAE